MRRDAISASMRVIDVGAARVAYRDEGQGRPVLLLHGCPFSSFIWRKVVPMLSPHFRCLAPDLLGLGDTETPADADWSLPAQARTVLAFLDALSIGVADVVGHDHGGSPRSCWPDTSGPISGMRIAAPRPGASSPGRSIRTTTGRPSPRCPA